MANWKRLTPEDRKSCPPMYRNHFGSHDIGYQDALRQPPQGFNWVRLEADELLALSKECVEVQELAKAYQRLYDICHFLTVRQVIDLGDDAIIASGLNPWCLNEDLASGDERISLDWAKEALAPFEEMIE